MKPNFIQRVLSSILLLLMLLGGAQLATQVIALKLNFQPGLGEPLVGWMHLYNPLDFIVWTTDFWNMPDVRPYLMPGLYLFLMILAVTIYFAVEQNLREYRQNKKAVTHGSARFVTWKEVENQTQLLDNENPLAVYVGGFPHKRKIYYLKDHSPTHIFAYAPSRSGKGVGLIVPTLLTYEGSCIISDFKLENWQLTASTRQQMGHTVLKFDPTCTDGTAASFNPLMEIRQGYYEVRDAQLIADMLTEEAGTKKNDHWKNSANSLLVSAILHVLYFEENKSLSGVRDFLSDPTRTEQQTLLRMQNAIHDPDQKQSWLDRTTKQPTMTHPVVAFGAREMLNKSDPERTGIFSTALTALKLYRDPVVAMNTQAHDFTIASLVYSEKPVSLYLGIPPSDIERTMPLMRLMLQLILGRLTEKLEANKGIANRRQLLLMLDEFPQFGKLPFIEKALGYSAGYNIRAYLISQDIQQVNKTYGRDHSIISNCGIRIAFTPNTLETARQLSEVLGVTTIQNPNRSYSGQRLSPMLERMTLSYDEIKRPLMTTDELLRLGSDASLIFLNGLNPIQGHKLYYYQDPFFKDKIVLTPPSISDRFKTTIVWKHVGKVEEEVLLPDIFTETPENVPIQKNENKKTAPAITIQGLKEIFLNWVCKNYLEERLSVNQHDSLLHRVQEGVFLVTPNIVSLFLKENPDVQEKTEGKDVERLIGKLMKPNALGKIKHYFWGNWEDRQTVTGFIVPLVNVFRNKIPSRNEQLQRDVTHE